MPFQRLNQFAAYLFISTAIFFTRRSAQETSVPLIGGTLNSQIESPFPDKEDPSPFFNQETGQISDQPPAICAGDGDVGTRARQWLWEEFYPKYGPLLTRCQRLSYDWSININDDNKRKMNECDLQMDELLKWGEREGVKFDVQAIQNESVGLQIRKLVDRINLLDVAETEKLNELSSQMKRLYSTARICPFDNQNCNTSKVFWKLDREIKTAFDKSRDPDLLKYAWSAFHKTVGRGMKEDYASYVRLSNKQAQLANFSDYGALLRHSYDGAGVDIRHVAEDLWREILPLYEELYSHVRRRLSNIYPNLIDLEGPIPAHLLGNMWAQQWEAIFSLVAPSNLTSSIMDLNTIQAMKAQGYSPLKMFQTAEDFFKSIGFPALPKSFYDNSLIEQPKDRQVICHGSAWDMYNSHDFMVKMCTNVDQDDLNTIHHELGHIYYYLAYKDLPLLLRRGANPAFHEAVGDTILLSARVPKYLMQIGLLKQFSLDEDAELNEMMKQALDFISFYPFGYLIDLWRWDVFAGKVPENHWNHWWWQLRYKYQGVTRPIAAEPEDFDPGAKYHVPSGTPYIRYFFARFLVFQFHQALCNESDPGVPLHRCTIYGNKRAGDKLWNMLKVGQSQPWPETLATLTGSRSISAEPVKTYFRPLIDWLKVENSRYPNNCYGWGQTWPGNYSLPQPRCPENEFNTRNY